LTVGRFSLIVVVHRAKSAPHSTGTTTGLVRYPADFGGIDGAVTSF
jgi:hypothetical protein